MNLTDWFLEYKDLQLKQAALTPIIRAANERIWNLIDTGHFPTDSEYLAARGDLSELYEVRWELYGRQSKHDALLKGLIDSVDMATYRKFHAELTAFNDEMEQKELNKEAKKNVA